MKNIQLFEKYHELNESSISANMKSNYNKIKQAVDKANKLLGINVGGNDKLFMIEIAMTETKLGTDANTVRTSGDAGRGVWQLDKVGFESSKDYSSHPKIKIYIERLKKAGIDWVSTEWDKCNEVLYGAIAARLVLLNKPFDIAATVEERAKQWKQHYNSESGAGSAEEYLERVKVCETTIGIHNLAPSLPIPKPKPVPKKKAGAGLVNFLSFKGRKSTKR